MNKKRTFFISLIFLVTIACVLPGLSSTPPTPIFASTIDTGSIETKVAGTVSAALAQTEQHGLLPQLHSQQLLRISPPRQHQQRHPLWKQTHLKAR
jgi:hypothetical protein